MVVERFRPGCATAVYARFERRGRLLPEGLEYVASWRSADGERCFQLMRAEHPALFQAWFERCADRVEFELHELHDG